MNNSQQIAERIKQRAKSMNISLKEMLTELELGINIISQFSKGREMSYLNLANIAEYLECSVDYLLGNTDNPTGAKTDYAPETLEFMKRFEQLSDDKKKALLDFLDAFTK